MNKVSIFLLSSIIACGPTNEEIQAQIDEAVESALERTTTTTLAPTTTTTVDTERQICLYFLESFRIVSNGIKDTGQFESDVLNSLSQNKISWESAYELQLDVVDFYTEWLDTWENAYPNNNNIEFWNNYVEIYRLRALSAISLAQYYYYYDEAYFRESNDFLGQAQKISQRTSFNSC